MGEVAVVLQQPLARRRCHRQSTSLLLVLGIVQFASTKGTLPHRALGWTWVVLMMTVAVSSFWIRQNQIRLGGPWSPIHLLSIFSLIMLPLGIWFAHRHRVNGHRITMISLFTGGLVIAGLFTFVPGRIVHAIAFGQ